MLEKTYQPRMIEEKFYTLWESQGVMQSGKRPQAEPYTIMMPPPNVTGSLHMGHALTFTIQDILVRYHRMLGLDVLWQPGTDHAGIATQMIVEREIGKENLTRHSLGREAFLDKVWAWKEQSGNTIVNQLRHLSVSPDWSRQRFTLDEGLSQAVRKVFVDLYNQGLLYRDKRLVNWDPKLQTALSDLEVENREEEGTLWYIAYPLAHDPTQAIVVATRRPETMFGDAAIAVAEGDERYAAFVGHEVMRPIDGRPIPVITDIHADPEKGSGAVKITPAHDFNDFEVGRRHNLPMVNTMDILARLNDQVAEAYQGLDRFEARKKVLETLEKSGHLIKEEKTISSLPYGDRSGVLLEPRLTDQWYVDAKTLAQPALEAVRSGKTKFVPEFWTATYYEWLENIQPWCISRQLWWGHRIPAWYGPDGHVFVAKTEQEAKTLAEQHYGHAVPMHQDEDVLDTWFSSALWPFSTLGWPEKTPELDRYYPTDVLVTGFDIIFFWVARMMMMGIHFMGEVPFKTVAMHALVRDEKGQKMSKTKGNVIDPLTLIDQYGADALRFSLAALAAPGRDLKFGTSHVESYRNFATKLWNASRFALMNQCTYEADFNPLTVNHLLNQWIIRSFIEVRDQVTQALEAYQFNEMASALYHFIWGIFCDWYLECAKQLFAESTEEAEETRKTTGWILGNLYHLLHPVMPSVSEELWAHLNPQGGLLALSSWPVRREGKSTVSVSSCVMDDFSWMMALITQVRAVRAEVGIAPGQFLTLHVHTLDEVTKARIERLLPFILKLARLSSLETVQAFKEKSLQFVVQGMIYSIPVEGIVDIQAERERLAKEIKKTLDDAEPVRKKLNNPQFIERAKEEVVEENRERLAACEVKVQKLQEALQRLPT